MPTLRINTVWEKLLAGLVTLSALFGLYSLIYSLVVRPCIARKPECASTEKVIQGKCATKCTDDSKCKISEYCTGGFCQEAKVCHNTRCNDEAKCPYNLKCVDGFCKE